MGRTSDSGEKGDHMPSNCWMAFGDGDHEAGKCRAIYVLIKKTLGRYGTYGRGLHMYVYLLERHQPWVLLFFDKCE